MSKNAFAWNEPGKDKNPWGNRNDGPPDLDKIFNDFFSKFSKIFNGNGGNSNNIVSKGFSFNIIAIIVLVLYLASGIYIVQPEETAVITRFGAFVRNEEPGIHWIPTLIERATKINTSEIKHSKHGGAMLTADENIVQVEIAVQYRVNNANNFMFNTVDPILSLQQASESALRHVIGSSKLDYVLTDGRAQIAIETKKHLEQILDKYRVGLEISDVAIRLAKAPDPVKSAFDDVIKAREELESAINQANAYANEVEPGARGEAQKMIEEAQAYKTETILQAKGEVAKFNLILPEYNMAPEITKKRLYLEAMEEVLANTSKVLIDSNGNNNLIYLPIDKLIGSDSEATFNKLKNQIRYTDPKTRKQHDDYQEDNVTKFKNRYKSKRGKK